MKWVVPTDDGFATVGPTMYGEGINLALWGPKGGLKGGLFFPSCSIAQLLHSIARAEGEAEAKWDETHPELPGFDQEYTALAELGTH